MENHIVIMAGGIGSRFWPMSTPEYPKQFIDVMGCGKSLIQLTVERFAPLCPMENFWVVTSEKYTDIVKRTVTRFARMQYPGRADCPQYSTLHCLRLLEDKETASAGKYRSNSVGCTGDKHR